VEFDSHDLPVSDLAELVRKLVGLVGQLSLPGPKDGAKVTWIVRTISKESPLRIEIAPLPVGTQPEATLRLIETLPNVVTDGVRRLKASAERPAGFSDIALGALRDLAQLTSRGQILHLRSTRESVEITRQLIPTVERILSPEPYSTPGSVEGHLELVNVHGGKRYFAVYDDLTGQRAEVSFGDQVPLDDVARALGKRVEVEGEIVYRGSDEIVSVTASALRVFRPDDELPSIEDVIGILRV
jgi:hypothetical protein